MINALAAADAVLIPLQADYLATKGVKLLLDTIEAVTARLNPSLQIAGILLTLADPRTAHTREVVERTRSTFAGGIRVFETVIRMSVRLKEAPIMGQSIWSTIRVVPPLPPTERSLRRWRMPSRRAQVPQEPFAKRPSALEKLTGSAVPVEGSAQLQDRFTVSQQYSEAERNVFSARKLL